jgi:molybdopterin/thiamine biosynthesis adenylyltransferase
VNIDETLSRTALLVQGDVFPELTRRDIVRGLTSLDVRLAADAATAGCAAGQTALTTALMAVAQVGARVRLNVPDVAVASSQPPLRGTRLRQALLDLAGDLVLPASLSTDRVDLAFVFGDASSGAAGEVFHVEAEPWLCRLQPEPGSGVRGEQPFGALLAGAAAGAESLRTSLRLIATRTGARPLAEHNLARPPAITLRLPELPSTPIDLGAVDAISGGAITNAALSALLRCPGLRCAMRVVDDDIAAESNLNRYGLLRRSALGQPKVAMLKSFATQDVSIEPLDARFAEASLSAVLPLAQRVLVGVDDIPSRWLVSRHAPNWVCVAGTTHFAAIVSEHIPSGPCAGCLHPVDDPGNQQIPTVSFVSALAGFLQAYRLVAHGHGVAPAPPVLASPFNLAAPRALARVGLAARADCPVGCQASLALR